MSFPASPTSGEVTLPALSHGVEWGGKDFGSDKSGIPAVADSQVSSV